MSIKGKSVIIVTIIIVLMLVIGVIGVFFKFTNGFKENFKSFYIKLDGKVYTEKENSLILDYGKEYKFECKYVFNLKEESSKNFNVKVIPNNTEENNFNISVDGELMSFLEIEELTSGFEIYENDGGFVLNIPEDFNIAKCLDKVFSSKQVILPEGLYERDLYYTLVITSYNEKVTYYFNFGVYVNAVTLDKEVIQF